LLITAIRVKDDSEALYCFVPQGKTIKVGTNSLTRSLVFWDETEGYVQIIFLFRPVILLNNCLKFNPDVSGVKSLFGLQKFYNFATQFYYVN
jgi:hypothetical protein